MLCATLLPCLVPTPASLYYQIHTSFLYSEQGRLNQPILVVTTNIVDIGGNVENTTDKRRRAAGNKCTNYCQLYLT